VLFNWDFPVEHEIINNNNNNNNKPFSSKVRNNERVLFSRINHLQENKAQIKHKTLKHNLPNVASLFISKSGRICNFY
jgi:hypothetical protein